MDLGGLPVIVRDGKQNGVWFRSGVMIMANEFTTKNEDFVQAVPFKQILNHTLRLPDLRVMPGSNCGGGKSAL